MSNISECKRYVGLQGLIGDRQNLIFKAYEDTDDVEIVEYRGGKIKDISLCNELGKSKNIDTVVIPEFVTKIRRGVFENAYRPLVVEIDNKQIKSLDWLFSGYKGSSIKVFGDTCNLKSMRYMFLGCSNLRNIEIRLNTSEVKSMKAMFAGCGSIMYLDLSELDTYNVRDMNYMFRFCMNLRELNLSNMKTHNVKTMAHMFSDCLELERLDIGKFDTNKVKDMQFMFSGCTNLKKLIIENLDTRNVINMHGMFEYCYELKELKTKNIKLKSVRDLDNMIVGCGIESKYLDFKIKCWKIFVEPIIKVKKFIRKYKFIRK